MPWRLQILFVLLVGVLVAGQTIGIVTTLAGGLGGTTSGHADGVGTAATFNVPSYVAVDVPGTVAVVVEYANNLIRRISLSTIAVTTLAGTFGVSGTVDGIGTAALFNYPYGVAIDAAATFVVVVRCLCTTSHAASTRPITPIAPPSPPPASASHRRISKTMHLDASR